MGGAPCTICHPPRSLLQESFPAPTPHLHCGLAAGYSSHVSTHPFPGTKSHGILTGFNKTVLRTLPRSRNLIVVESVLMAVAFSAMLLVRLGLVGRRSWEQGVLSPASTSMWSGRRCRLGA